MATSDGVREYQRVTPARPVLLAAGVALLAPTLKWLIVYVFKDA
jgi:hypothetical protein